MLRPSRCIIFEELAMLRLLPSVLACFVLASLNARAQRALPLLPASADLNTVFHEPVPTTVHDIASVGDELWVLAITNYLGDDSSTLWKWDGTNYSTVDCPFLVNSGSSNSVGLRFVEHEGELYLCGRFEASGDVLKYDGSTWEDLGANSNMRIHDLAVYNEVPYIVGDFTEFNGQAGNQVYRLWNGSWEAVGSPSNGELLCIEVHDEKLYVGGEFSAMGMANNNIARLGEADWEPVGVGLDGAVTDMATYMGELYAVGNFFMNGTQTSTLNRITRLVNDNFLGVTNDSDMVPPNPKIDHIGFELYICSRTLSQEGCAILGEDGIAHFDAFPMACVAVHEGGLLFASTASGSIAMDPYTTMLYRYDPYRVTNTLLDNGNFCIFSSFGPTQIEDPFDEQSGCGTNDGPTAATEFSEIWSASLWYAGNADGQIYGGGSMFYPGHENDALKVSYGPISDSYDHDYLHRYYAIWKLTKEDIEHHLAHYQDAGYQPIGSIITYPGNGRVDFGESSHLLPFVDSDEDGWYEPMDGDYPLLRGDQSTFTIHSDGRYGNPADKAGMELITEMYSFDNTDDAIAHTTFVHTEIRNRSMRDYTDFSVGVSCLFAIEEPSSDFAGSSPEGDYFYGFNAQYDQGVPQVIEVVNPAQAVAFLSDELYATVVFNQVGSNEANGPPDTPADFYAYLNGRWKNGQPMYFGGNGIDVGVNTDIVTTHIYPDFPWETSEDDWNEVTAGNVPSNRRLTGSVTPFDFPAGTSHCLDYSYITAYPGNDEPYNEVAQLDQRVADVKLWFEAQLFACEWPQFPLNVDSTTKRTDPIIYPNPSDGRIRFANVEGLRSTVIVRDVFGSELHRFELIDATAAYTLPDLAPGMYLIQLADLNTSFRLILR